MTVLQTSYDPALHAEIRDLARRRNAVILAHNYERPEIQDVADYVGDSLGLSREAAKTEAGRSCSAACTSWPRRRRSCRRQDRAAARPRRGCSLASTIDAEQLRAWKAEHPGAVVVAYVNTTADVKARATTAARAATPSRW
jgi:quinolinate synthase